VSLCAKHDDGRTGGRVKTLIVGLALAALLAIPLAAPASAAPLPDRGIPVVETGHTARFEGGEWVRVRIGDVSLGVHWTTNESLRKGGVTFFLDYKRFFGAAELYDEQGNYLGTRALPIHTFVVQHFDRMFEFLDDGDGLFDLRPETDLRNRSAGDVPVKYLDLNTGWYLDGPIVQVVTPDAAWVNFTVSAADLPYGRVWDNASRTWRGGLPSDGALERISLTFHLAATAEDRGITFPVYRVTLASGREQTPVASEFLENRTRHGSSITVDGKYDQRIEGWDFVGDARARLGMATGLTFGNKIASPVLLWMHEQFGGACLRGDSFRHCESEAGPTRPVPIARDRLEFAEEWHRAGDWYWVSPVTVDGRPDTMTFEIYHAERVRDLYDGHSGVRALGGFVYPQGQVIEHDPGLRATSAFAAIADTTNVAPSILVALQIAVVGGALVPAVLVRRKARKGRA